jgi:hypothetical protein
LKHASFVDEVEWQRHLADRFRHPTEFAVVDSSAPVIRVLRCAGKRYGISAIPARAFPYLAHLPHLRELECGLLPQGIRALGLLPQLEKLRLWLVPGTDFSANSRIWTADAVRRLGGLPLHRLHTLRLEGDDERNQWHEGMGMNDPDFPCQTQRSGSCISDSCSILPNIRRLWSLLCVLFSPANRGNVEPVEARFSRYRHAGRTAPFAQPALAHLASSTVDSTARSESIVQTGPTDWPRIAVHRTHRDSQPSFALAASLDPLKFVRR